jgi:hypothetical protein
MNKAIKVCRRIAKQMTEETGDRYGISPYTGRGMNKECLSLSAPDVECAIEFVMKVKEELGNGALKGMRTDSLGRRIVAYWPHVLYSFAESQELEAEDGSADRTKS